MGKIIAGLHAPNAAFQEIDYVTAIATQAESIKLMATEPTKHTQDEMTRLRAGGVTDFVLRLPDSLLLSGRIPGDQELARTYINLIAEYYPLGVRLFSLCNEPNYLFKTRAFGPFEYVWFMKRVVRLVRQGVKHLPGVKLISPPLSFAPAMWGRDPEGTPQHLKKNPSVWILDEWLAAFEYRKDFSSDMNERERFWDFFDYAGANCYWQYAKQLHDPSYGAGWETVNQKSGKEVVVLEWASSTDELWKPNTDTAEPLYAPHELDALRSVQYPEWLERAYVSGKVVRAYTYIMPGATQDWAGKRVTPAVAAAMAKWSSPCP